MPKALRVALVVLGLSLAVWGGVGLVGSLLGWDSSPPEVRSKTLVTPQGQEIKVRQILRDGGEVKVGGLLFVIAGLALATFAAWPRGARPTPPRVALGSIPLTGVPVRRGRWRASRDPVVPGGMTTSRARTLRPGPFERRAVGGQDRVGTAPSVEP